MNPVDLIPSLRASGLISGDDVRFRPLAGGVSSDIYLVEAPGARFVIKAALAKLRVRDDWFADISRNAVEQDYFAYAAGVVPDAVPRILGADRAAGWFAMEYLEGGWVDWKQRLLRGEADAATARRAGEILGRLHAASWGDADVEKRFATLKNFHELRISPYLLTTAERVPAIRNELVAEATRLAAARIALVHGDYSPKNLLVASPRVVVLDAEVGWYGDPAFDCGFLLNHLHLKALLHFKNPDPLLALVSEFWRAYAAAVGPHFGPELEWRTVRLLLCLMLARVHGKSPVEYLTSSVQHDLITRFVVRHLPQPMTSLAALTSAWRTALTQR